MVFFLDDIPLFFSLTISLCFFSLTISLCFFSLTISLCFFSLTISLSLSQFYRNNILCPFSQIREKRHILDFFLTLSNSHDLRGISWQFQLSKRESDGFLPSAVPESAFRLPGLMISLLPTVSHQSALLTGPLTKLVSFSFTKNENSVHFMPAMDYSFHTSSQRWVYFTVRCEWILRQDSVLHADVVKIVFHDAYSYPIKGSSSQASTNTFCVRSEANYRLENRSNPLRHNTQISDKLLIAIQRNMVLKLKLYTDFID